MAWPLPTRPASSIATSSQKILVAKNGYAKLSDFGLAKLDEASSTDVMTTTVTESRTRRGMIYAGESSAPDLLHAPTATVSTREGIILGTPAYMSPEQARGQTVDKRTDIWAFGCVLYEMLTGTHAFAADDVSGTLAHVLMKEPDWEVLPATTPPAIRKLLHRCLAKGRRQRLSDAADARLEIEDALTESTGLTVTALPAPRQGWVRRAAAFAAGVALLVGGMVVGLSVWLTTRPVPPRVVRTMVTTSGTTAFAVTELYPDLAISPDGRRLAYRGVAQ